MAAFIVGLTGPTGAGKTTITKVAEDLGFFVIDADKVAREATQKGSPLLPLLENEFGGVVKNGELDRKALAQKAFSSKENTEKLNYITLPYIVNNISGIIEKAESEGKTLILLDAPTLFEAGANNLCHKTVAVLADKNERLKRIMARDGLTKAQAECRMNASKSDEFYNKYCDIILYNNKGENAFLTECEKTFKTILENT